MGAKREHNYKSKETPGYTMLNPVFIKILRMLVTVGSFFGFLPFKLDNERGKLRVDLRSRAKSIHSAMWLVAYSWLVLPTHTYELYRMQNLHKLSYTVVIMLCATMGIILDGLLTINSEGVCQFLNAFYKLLESFPEKYMPNYDYTREKLRMKLTEAAFIISTALCVWLGFMVAIHSWLEPSAPAYMLFMIPKESLTLPVYIIASTWFSIYAVNVTVVLATIPLHGLCYFIYVLPILHTELRLGLSPSKYKAIGILREPNQLVVNYKMLQIFVKMVNNEFGILFVVLQLLFIQIILFCNVTLMFQWQDLKINTKILLTFIAGFATCGWATFLFVAGIQYGYSEAATESWKLEYWSTRTERLYMERVKWSLRPFSFGDGKRFIIKPVTVLKYIDSVSINTFRSLITYGNVLGY
ncbi:unnamed protein product [Orchesella dallaii]|uniref:Odorant receptor n=1 Tax=Orchesella dallaii TaxID=48710 RepID=A0ABP1PP60_9HEXA